MTQIAAINDITSIVALCLGFCYCMIATLDAKNQKAPKAQRKAKVAQEAQEAQERKTNMADTDLASGRSSQVIKMVMPTYIMAPSEDER